MERTIVHTWFFQHSPERVWDYLTKPELIELWLMKTDFKAEAGCEFMFRTKPLIKLGFDGNVYCKVLVIDPPKKLSYSWKGGPRKGKVSLDSVVTWTLTEKNGGTELLLEHSGFRGMKNYFSYLIMNKGWAKIGKRVSSLIQNASK